MDIINSTRPAPFGAFAKTVVSNLFGGVVSYVVAELNVKRTRVALEGLSSRQLDDIGLTRGDIGQASRLTTLLR